MTPTPTYTPTELLTKYSQHLSWLLTNHKYIGDPAYQQVVNQLLRLNTLVAKRKLRITPEYRSKSDCTCGSCQHLNNLRTKLDTLQTVVTVVE